MAAITNFTIEQGTTFTTTVTVKQATGVAFNLTGYTPRAQMRKSFYSTSKTDFTAAVEGAAANGQVTLSLTATQTAALTDGRYVYDIEIDNGTTVYRVLEGMVTITPNVTR